MFKYISPEYQEKIQGQLKPSETKVNEDLEVFLEMEQQKFAQKKTEQPHDFSQKIPKISEKSEILESIKILKNNKNNISLALSPEKKIISENSFFEGIAVFFLSILEFGEKIFHNLPLFQKIKNLFPSFMSNISSENFPQKKLEQGNLSHAQFLEYITKYSGKGLRNKLMNYSQQDLAFILKNISPMEVWKLRKQLDNPSSSNNFSAKNLQSLLQHCKLLDMQYSENEMRNLVKEVLHKKGYKDKKLLFSAVQGEKPKNFEEEVLWIIALLKQESSWKPFNVSWTGALGLGQMTRANYQGGALDGAFNPFGNPKVIIGKTITHLEKNIQELFPDKKTFKNVITAYNRGVSNVMRGNFTQQGEDYYPAIEKHFSLLEKNEK